MAARPKVSVIVITYNQKGYIAQTLEGIVTQQTNFDFEVIVADDHSTDGTAKIVQGYTEKYPERVKPIYRKQNLGPQPNFKGAILKATGQYIALCEGDDFWTDITKLQRQVNFLDSHKDYSLCFHPVRVFFENGEQDEAVYPNRSKTKEFTLENLLKENFIQTNSVLYRKQDYSKIPTDILPLDWYMHLLHAKAGKIGFINRVMASYRRHPGGIWWNSYKDIEKIWIKYGTPHLAFYKAVLDLFPDQSEYIMRNVSTALEGVVAVANSSTVIDTIASARKTFSKYIDQILQIQLEKNITYRKEVAKQATVLSNQTRELENLATTKERLSEELSNIKSSRSWRLTGAMRGIVFGIRYPLKALKRLRSKRTN